MGEFVADGYVPMVQAQVNLRFAPGDALAEMIALQKEFELFSPQHSLKSTAAVLNIVPPKDKDRRGFFRYLDRLKAVGSDQAKVNGHDRIVTAVKNNLESKRPMPVFFTFHATGSSKPTVLVSVETPLAFATVKYLTVSVPTIQMREKAALRKR